jgi:hypothetical protein
VVVNRLSVGQRERGTSRHLWMWRRRFGWQSAR